MKLYKKMDSTNTVLLVIDIMNSCAHEKCELLKLRISFSKIRRMVPKLVSFIDQYRNIVNGLVIFTNTTPWKKEYLAENINELYTDPATTYYSEDNTGFAEKFYQVKPQGSDIVVTKNHYDVFTTTDLDNTLKNKKIKYLIVVGVFGDGCVLASIVGGFSKGYNFVILKDLIETTDSQTRQELQTKLKEYTWPIMYGKTLDSAEFLKSWQNQLKN